MRQTFITMLLLVVLSNRTQAMTGSELRDSIVSFAASYVGVPYLYAGASENGFDCTGFVYYVFNHFGVKTSRSSSGYENVGTEVPLEDCQKGDIMLFTGTNSEIRKVGHAGIIYENSDGQVFFIHSSSSKNHFGVTVTNFTTSPGYQKRFLRVINIL